MSDVVIVGAKRTAIGSFLGQFTGVPTPTLGTAAIAVDEDGISYIMWPDLADTQRKLWCARFHPDSGLAVPMPTLPLACTVRRFEVW